MVTVIEISVAVPLNVSMADKLTQINYIIERNPEVRVILKQL